MVGITPRPHFTPGKDSVPILQAAGCAPGPVWTGGKSRPHQDSITDRPARSQSLYRLSYPDHQLLLTSAKIRDEWSNSHPCCSTPTEITVSIRLGRTRSSSGLSGKRKPSFPCRKSNYELSSPHRSLWHV